MSAINAVSIVRNTRETSVSTLHRRREMGSKLRVVVEVVKRVCSVCGCLGYCILYPPVFICILYAVCCMLDTYESYYMAMMTSGRHISAQAAILPVVPLGITPPGNNPSPIHFILYVCHRRSSQPATHVHPRRAINRLGRPSGLPSFPRGVGLALTSTNSQISTSLTIPII